tara:strand:- start:707 stop:1219 length:513 start_codon:yes stop_codon:yes gene_type:complete
MKDECSQHRYQKPSSRVTELGIHVYRVVDQMQLQILDLREESEEFVKLCGSSQPKRRGLALRALMYLISFAMCNATKGIFRMTCLTLLGSGLMVLTATPLAHVVLSSVLLFANPTTTTLDAYGCLWWNLLVSMAIVDLYRVIARICLVANAMTEAERQEKTGEVEKGCVA